jgi:hypothetical protein
VKDDNDRLRAGTLPDDAFVDSVAIDGLDSGDDPQSREFRPFPVEALPEPLFSFVVEAASAIGCDVTYVALPALAGLAASIGNTRRAKLKGGWFEPSVLWTAIVGESGTLKSPALDVALAPLRRLQAKAIDQYRVEKKKYDEEMERYLDAKRSRKRSRSGDDLAKPEAPVPWRILCSDITTEALASILAYSPRGLLLVRDELSGWIKGFDQYKKTQGADAARFLSMHRAGDFLSDRKTNNEIICVQRAAVSITGGIQPRILRRALGEEHLDNGLAARLLLTMPPRLPKRWTEAEISAATASSFCELYGRLLDLEFAIDGDGEKVPIDLSLTPTGKNAWVRFFNGHGIEQAQREGDAAAAFSKLEGYCARFALLVHLIRVQSGDHSLETEHAIDRVSIESGVALTTWFAYETERVYAALGIAPAAPTTGLMEIIHRRGGRISARELMHASRQHRGSSEMARAALQRLVDAGLGSWARSATGRVGRPVEVFQLNSESGNSGNGNRTLAADGGSHAQGAESTASDDRRPRAVGHAEAGNRTPGTVTGEEVAQL